MLHNSVLIKIQPDATVYRYLFTEKSLYMFRVSQHPSVLIRPRWRELAVPEVAFTVFSTPDDFAVNKYLHTVASGWIFINTKYQLN